jgi:uncharacterized protein (TIGR02594 family)
MTRDQERLLSVALMEVGQREIAGLAANVRIAEYHHATTLPADLAASDETAWCSSFLVWCCAQVGIASTRSAAARSWLSWGRALEASESKFGGIAVLSRPPNPASGHVGLWVGQRGDRVYLLGGNQGNAVSVQSFPVSRVLSVRVLA